MIRKLLKEASGYSLVEVMASIMILAMAIIPLMGMFDMGLHGATEGSRYDEARALANQRLATAKSLRYTTVRDYFPNNTCNLNDGDGTCNSVTTPEGFSYTITKEFVDDELAASDEDVGLIEITVSVRGPGDSLLESPYATVHGVVAQ